MKTALALDPAQAQAQALDARRRYFDSLRSDPRFVNLLTRIGGTAAGS